MRFLYARYKCTWHRFDHQLADYRAKNFVSSINKLFIHSQWHMSYIFRYTYKLVWHMLNRKFRCTRLLTITHKKKPKRDKNEQFCHETSKCFNRHLSGCVCDYVRRSYISHHRDH